MLRIKGELRGEYFHVLREECGANTYNEYLGFETEQGYSDGVPHLKVTCKECNQTEVLVDDSDGKSESSTSASF
jgi:hypothetical protein